MTHLDTRRTGGRIGYGHPPTRQVVYPNGYTPGGNPRIAPRTNPIPYRTPANSRSNAHPLPQRQSVWNCSNQNDIEPVSPSMPSLEADPDTNSSETSTHTSDVSMGDKSTGEKQNKTPESSDPRNIINLDEDGDARMQSTTKATRPPTPPPAIARPSPATADLRAVAGRLPPPIVTDTRPRPPKRARKRSANEALNAATVPNGRRAAPQAPVNRNTRATGQPAPKKRRTTTEPPQKERLQFIEQILASGPNEIPNVYAKLPSPIQREVKRAVSPDLCRFLDGFGHMPSDKNLDSLKVQIQLCLLSKRVSPNNAPLIPQGAPNNGASVLPLNRPPPRLAGCSMKDLCDELMKREQQNNEWKKSIIDQTQQLQREMTKTRANYLQRRGQNTQHFETTAEHEKQTNRIIKEHQQLSVECSTYRQRDAEQKQSIHDLETQIQALRQANSVLQRTNGQVQSPRVDDAMAKNVERLQEGLKKEKATCSKQQKEIARLQNDLAKARDEAEKQEAELEKFRVDDDRVADPNDDEGEWEFQDILKYDYPTEKYLVVWVPTWCSRDQLNGVDDDYLEDFDRTWRREHPPPKKHYRKRKKGKRTKSKSTSP